MSKNSLFAAKIAFGVLVLGLLLFDALPQSVNLSLFAVAYILLGYKVFLGALSDFKSGKFMRESFLMSVATLCAVGLGEYAEALAVLLFYAVGQYFEDFAINRSKSTISSLLALRPTSANLVKSSGAVEKVEANSVKIGDELLINPHERVPLDAVIIKGNAYVDTKALTGESVPKFVRENDELLSGFINGENALKVRVIRAYEDSSISKILRLISESTERKARLERSISKFASIYTPVVVVVAVLLTLLPCLMYGFSEFSAWFERSLTLLVVSCPCAFMIGVPLTYFSAIGRASKFGVIVKGGVFMDILAKTNIVVFDKTGTLTKGEFSVISTLNLIEKHELLSLVAHCEFYSSHPIALCLVREFKKMGGKIQPNLIKNAQEFKGQGTKALINGRLVLVGKAEFLLKNGVKFTPQSDFNAFVAVDGTFVGAFLCDDEIKEGAKESLANLAKMGIETALISGDSKERVKEFAAGLHFDELFAQCLPDEKLAKLEHIASGKVAVFVGDGINDAPCLVRADVGVAMGALGSDAAVANADIIITDDKLNKLEALLRLAYKMRAVLWQNVILALSVKFAALVLGALGWASMWMAIFADTGVTALVVFNALRLLYPLGFWRESFKENDENLSVKKSENSAFKNSKNLSFKDNKNLEFKDNENLGVKNNKNSQISQNSHAKNSAKNAEISSEIPSKFPHFEICQHCHEY